VYAVVGPLPDRAIAELGLRRADLRRRLHRHAFPERLVLNDRQREFWNAEAKDKGWEVRRMRLVDYPDSEKGP